MRRRRTEITVETDQVFVIRPHRSPHHAWCSECAEPSSLVPVHQAAQLIRVHSRRVYGWMAADQLHYREMEDGRLLICLNTLLAQAASETVAELERSHETFISTAR
jgi:hypothetical protein